MNLKELENISVPYPDSPNMPVWFIGHGSPMNAIQDNTFTRKLKELGNSLINLPKAVLVVSAHWLTPGSFVTISEKLKTIHDFGGFPKELYQIQYPAPGSPEFAKETQQQITSTAVKADEQWGLDHGAWTILMHLFPKANIPVFQLSIDYHNPPQYHFNLARELIELREKGVLIIGSGNIVHNLYEIDFDSQAKPNDWAIEFNEKVKTSLIKREFNDLINYKTLGKSAKLAVPTNEHYLPMLYCLGLTNQTDDLQITYEEIQNASISMLCFQVS